MNTFFLGFFNSCQHENQTEIVKRKIIKRKERKSDDARGNLSYGVIT